MNGARKKAVIIVNIGSPDSLHVPDVRRYLKEFLRDPAVINLPAIPRYLLVNGLIAPFRSFRSSRLYSKLWTERGFPLIYHSRDLSDGLKQYLETDHELYLAMRYGKPSLAELLESLIRSGHEELLCIPLFPQFASSTSGSIVRILKKTLKNKSLYQNTKILLDFHWKEGFINIWKRKISKYNLNDYDAIVFSYHGIPVRQTENAHPGISCDSLDCELKYDDANHFCYRAACYQTTRSILNGLTTGTAEVYTSFQSRFGRNWLEPFTDKTLQLIAQCGKRKVLVVSPSFVADCLETKIEIEVEYTELFRESGGGEITLVPSLNSDPEWAGFLAELIRDSENQSLDLNKVNWKSGKIIPLMIRATNAEN
jgi:ferrochelatase